MTEIEYTEVKEKTDKYSSFKTKIDKLDEILNNFRRIVGFSLENKNGKYYRVEITDDIRSEMQTLLTNYKNSLVSQVEEL